MSARSLFLSAAAAFAAVCLSAPAQAAPHGGGGFHAGGFHAGGFRAGAVGGFRASGFRVGPAVGGAAFRGSFAPPRVAAAGVFRGFSPRFGGLSAARFARYSPFRYGRYGLYGLYPWGLGYGWGYGGYGYGGYGLDSAYGYGAYAPTYASYYPTTDVDLAAVPAGGENEQPNDNAAHLLVVVPANAEVWFDGSRTQQTGEEREFVSPPLQPGRTFSYAVKARWTQDGKTVEQTRTIPVWANLWRPIDFTQPEPPKEMPKVPAEAPQEMPKVP
jgi:uncharacterized protein (TIGR03000 family)